MRSFWTDNPGISTLIHDTNNRISQIGASRFNIEDAVKDGMVDIERIKRGTENIKKQLKLLMADIDAYYNKVKTQYEQERTKGSDRG